MKPFPYEKLLCVMGSPLHILASSSEGTMLAVYSRCWSVLRNIWNKMVLRGIYSVCSAMTNAWTSNEGQGTKPSPSTSIWVKQGQNDKGSLFISLYYLLFQRGGGWPQATGTGKAAKRSSHSRSYWNELSQSYQSSSQTVQLTATPWTAQTHCSKDLASIPAVIWKGCMLSNTVQWEDYTPHKTAWPLSLSHTEQATISSLSIEKPSATAGSWLVLLHNKLQQLHPPSLLLMHTWLN